jgi:hypothetical protein
VPPVAKAPEAAAHPHAPEASARPPQGSTLRRAREDGTGAQSRTQAHAREASGRMRAAEFELGAPTIRVQSISYSTDPSQRLVTLRIGKEAPVTLHEGESAKGVEVQLVLRDTVYVRHRGNVMALDVK